MNFRYAYACLLVSTAFITTPAAAADERTMAAAKKRFEDGVALYKANDVEGARRAMADSYNIRADASTLWDLALFEMETGHYLDSIRHFRSYQSDPHATAERLKRAPEHVARCAEHVGTFLVYAPKGAVVLIDEEAIARPEEPHDVEPGPHTVTLRSAGTGETRRLTVGAGQTMDVRFASGAAMPTGPEKDKGAPSAETRPTTKIVAAGALAAVGVAGIATGVGFGLAARSARDDAQQLGATHPCATNGPACDAAREKHDTQMTDTTLSFIAYGGGALFLAGAVATWFFWPTRKDTGPATGWAIVPTSQKGGAGLEAHFTF